MTKSLTIHVQLTGCAGVILPRCRRRLWVQVGGGGVFGVVVGVGGSGPGAADRLLKVEVPLEEAAPRGDVDVHLPCPVHLALLAEDLALSPQLGLARDHGVEELNLGEEEPLRLELQRHAVTHVVDELLEAEELDGAQRAPVAPVDIDLQLAGLLQVYAEPA